MRHRLPPFSLGRSRIWLATTLLALTGALGCAAHAPAPRQPDLVGLRREALATKDAELVGTWLLRELLSPGGDPTEATRARARLDVLGPGGMLAALARGLDDALHGRLAEAADHYLEAARAARDSGDLRAPLVAWFAANRAVSLTHDAPDQWKRWKPFVEQAVADPRGLGWRARGELLEWSIDEAWAEGQTDVDRRAIELYGCVTAARLAGPFGRGAAADAIRTFPAEKPGPWPYRWDPEPGVAKAPRLLRVESHSCAVKSDEHVGDGMFYVETFFDLPDDRELLIAVQGALAVRVDDALVLDRDVRQWGVWPRFGVSVKLTAGRHRLVARVGDPSTSIRLLRPDGTPSGISGSVDPNPPYSLAPPRVLASPNVIERWVHGGDVEDPEDDVTRFLAGFLAHLESSDDVASVLVAPLIDKIDTATGPALSLAALFADDDPIFEASQASDLVRELHERAAKKDPRLWASRLSLALGLAEKKGAEEAVPALERLAQEFPGAPDLLLAQARVYGQLGWSGEHARAIKKLVSLFPENLGALHAAVDVYDAEGDAPRVASLVGRIQRLDRDDEVALTRALAREYYAPAIAELERLARLHPDRKEIAERIHDARIRAGRTEDLLKKLEAAVTREPTNARARLDLADAHYAERDEKALRHAVADGVEAGASPALLTNAIDLVEGATELEPYRHDAREIIASYEKSGREMPGTAARILDYAALRVRADGSSRMLEHEIIRVQSAEAIATFAEHRALEGLVLHMRVIKQDGSTLEPEFIAGKSTVTFPHLEVGDYIETEQVVFSRGDGHGVEYAGPRWFFREENVGYARSEFVVVSPESRELVIETTGSVPPPTTETHDGFLTRRWRVDFSPAAAVEPGSTPITEFLPSVRIGWGLTLERRLRALSDALTQVAPVDPRIRRIAEHIVLPLPASDGIGRARRLYRWLLDNVEAGEEADGRRVVIGKRGNLWQGFRMLCRALDVHVRYAVAQSRLAAPALGPLSRSTLFAQPVARIEAGGKSAWLSLGNKYAPFGYVSADLRGMPAYFIDDARELTRIPEQGGADEIAFSGHGKLEPSGALTIDLVLEFSGKLAMALRRGLSQVPEQQLHGVLESNLLAQTLRGGSLQRHTIEHRDDFDSPLVIRMTVKVSRFAQPNGKTLVVSPPLAPDLGRLATLPTRLTPLLIPETLRRRIQLTIELPKGATVSGLGPSSLSDGDRRVTLDDSVKDGSLGMNRTIDIPAGRVQPSEYAAFAHFARQADDALSRGVQIRLP
jgi:tetratricopeptide (TPR) repeat protein